MNFKIMILAVISMLVIASLSVSGLSMQKIETQDSSEPVPELVNIYSNSAKIQDFGYTNILYKIYATNTLGEKRDLEMDFGDGTRDVWGAIMGTVIFDHEYSESGTYDIRVRYVGCSSWSEKIEFEVIDHCDLEIIDVFTEPGKFRKRSTIDIKATVENKGTVSTSENTELKLYEGYDDFDDDIPIAEVSTGIIAPGEKVTVTLENFKWYGDEFTHSFWAYVEPVDGEIDWTILSNADDENNNNCGDGHFTAPKVKNRNVFTMPVFLNLFEKMPMLRNLLS